MADRPRRLTATIAFVSVTLLFAAACGDEAAHVTTGSGGEDPGAGAQSTSAGQAPATPGGAPSMDDLVVSCGAVQFDELPPDPSSFPSLGDLADQIDFSVAEGEREFFKTHDWYVAAEADDELVLFGIPHEPHAEDWDWNPLYADAVFDREGNTWVPSGWGQCQVSVEAAGWGNARFILDPDIEPDPEVNSIAVQAWEMDCTSGKAPEGRKIESVVSEDDAKVTIVVLVEPDPGPATCPGNPSFPLEIELAAPLGDRTVVDASVHPALERPWPPTEWSLSTDGTRE
ncbi:hypothetical protein G1H11_08095 [Phytoactinopolyspora alkaliphila]|uniref:Secreted protein n=1 Tax=Phytoactinopolyspora alkaliphila TaxID=1783498 RepID=A0A6N9YK13_9ACTN|nr:hypothetical protein [Phytoactinopolyspora alkaliphila]NED95275.1 hypothetical protein [Phytoactinopolyspora alkaliphila]